jgi:hypothetical protein
LFKLPAGQYEVIETAYVSSRSPTEVGTFIEDHLMSLSIQLHSVRCLNESSEASDSDEVYALVTVATLRPPVEGLPIPAIPNFRVFRYGVFGDMDDDDESPVIVNGPSFWGMDGVAEEKEILGRIRSKYQNVPGAQGAVSMDGQALLQEAREDRQKWFQDLIYKFGDLPHISLEWLKKLEMENKK